MLTFNRRCFFLVLVLFFTEVLIALFVRDKIIRPYIGDLLIVMLLYCFIKSFIIISTLHATLIALLFSYFVEWLQYLNIVDMLGWRKYTLARVVIGTSFSWEDLLIYTIAAGFLLLTGKTRSNDPAK